jgi:hypothetical protein
MSEKKDELRDLLDKHACIELVQRYSRALDWLDEAALKTVFWSDAQIDFGFFKGRGEDFIKRVMEVERSLTRRWHMTCDPLVRVSGDVAEGESYGLAAGIMVRDGRAVHDIFGGRYLDQTPGARVYGVSRDGPTLLIGNDPSKSTRRRKISS